MHQVLDVSVVEKQWQKKQQADEVLARLNLLKEQKKAAELKAAEKGHVKNIAAAKKAEYACQVGLHYANQKRDLVVKETCELERTLKFKQIVDQLFPSLFVTKGDVVTSLHSTLDGM
jgi:exo-beta-1,3-glucanase (GH17 family)